MRNTLLPALFLFAALLSACGGGQPGAINTTTPTGNTTARPAVFSQLYVGVFKFDTVVVKLNVSDRTVEGSYFIKGKEDNITLTGTMLQGDTAEIYEFSKIGEKGGVFKGVFKGTDDFAGTWKPLPDGTPVSFLFTKTVLDYNPAKYAVMDTLKYEMVKAAKTNKKARCTIKIQYPNIVNPDKKPELGKINAALKKYFNASLGDCDGLERDEFSADLPDFENEAIGVVIFNKYNVFGVSMGWYSYTGGAHPNHGANTYYFDAITGRELKLIDWIQGPSLSKLSDLATKQFIKDMKVKTATEGGLFEDKIKLKGTESFYINDTTITLAFSPYEIAPYVMGDIEIKVGFSKLKPLVNGRSLFSKIIK